MRSCGVVEDVHHAIFECPYSSVLRLEYPSLFDNCYDLHSFFSNNNVFLSTSAAPILSIVFLFPTFFMYDFTFLGGDEGRTAESY
jgi:hypothetical protein